MVIYQTGSLSDINFLLLLHSQVSGMNWSTEQKKKLHLQHITNFGGEHLNTVPRSLPAVWSCQVSRYIMVARTTAFSQSEPPSQSRTNKSQVCQHHR